MTNMLIDLLPDTVDIGGKKFAIRTNFRTAILFEIMMQDDSLTDSEKAFRALELFYPVIPDNLNQATDQIIWFYTCGKNYRNKGKGGGGASPQRIYSFEYDDDYIYSAFLTQYGIDLQDIEYMHWWKFKAMFRTLSEDVLFTQIMGWRSMKITSKMTKEQREFYRNKKEIYALPLPQDEEEKQDAIAEALMNGGDLTGII